MRSENGGVDEWIDLPSLTDFKGDDNNFECIGSVVLESMDLVFDWCRYPSTAIQWNPITWLLFHLFPPILKYPFSPFLIIRCFCSRISHQRQKRLPLIPILVSFLPNQLPWCSWITEHSVNQPPTPSLFQTNKVPLNPFPARPQVTEGVCRQYHVITTWITPISQTHDSKTDRFHYQNDNDETNTNKPPPIPSQHSPHPQRLPTPHLLLFLSLHWLELVGFECDHKQ